MTDKTITRRLTSILCGTALLTLAACGGGGGGGGDTTAAEPTPGGQLASSVPASAAASATSTPTDPATAAGSAAVAPSTDSLTAKSAPVAAAAGAVPTLGDCQLFPANAVFNTRVDDTARFPAHPKSGEWVGLAGSNLPFTANWGFSSDPAAHDYWGMPVNIVDGKPGTTDWPVFSFDFASSGASTDVGYPFKSDCAVADGNGFSIVHDCTTVAKGQTHFPFPADSLLHSEGGLCNDPKSCGDRHVLVIEQGACRLWESWFSYKLSGQWYSMATAAWNLNSLALRPDNWASGDAAGLPITPLLVKAAEANSGEIRHALRATFRAAALSDSHVWPARFGTGGNPGGILFGSVLRLKADFVIPDNWTTQAKAVATAAKRYGIYVADIGPDFYIQGEPDSAWSVDTYNQLKYISLSNMEFVDLKSITSDSRFSQDSMAASW